MRILGIDPGTGILGFGVIDCVNYGKYKMVSAGLEEIYNSLKEIIHETNPDIMSVEKLFFARNVTTAISVSHARGVVLLTAKQAGIKIVEYTPLQIKNTLTGYGKADKRQVQEMVKVNLGLRDIPKPDDCADALAAAITHAASMRLN